ncbi:hypothetical protein ZHAS_00014988 [Anopheles sinensis]|uniref:Secreted protein n=1 Tax=Anopheles sinensis TaxID=74873 RepID=A0A084W9T5_ANOSI|nr:hypothetical protein ZHAS_00014988 [Anopheles sinensis]
MEAGKQLYLLTGFLIRARLSLAFLAPTRVVRPPSHGSVRSGVLYEDLRATPDPTTEVHSARAVHYEINLPTEMNKLSHPRKHFVGKIRPDCGRVDPSPPPRRYVWGNL